jgi:hypothetical protein
MFRCVPCLLAMLVVAPGCSTVSRFLAGPGGPVVFDADLPPPAGDEYLPNGLEIRIASPELKLDSNEDLMKSLVEGVRRSNADLRSVRGTGKKPTCSLLIYENGYVDQNDLSKLGGAVSGIVAGAATWVATDSLAATGLLGTAGALFGAFLFEQKIHTWSYAVIVKQHTSLDGVKKIRDQEQSSLTETGELDDASGFKKTQSESVRKGEATVEFDTKTNTRIVTRNFLVMVKGRGFDFTLEKAKELARQEVIQNLPSFVFAGGTVF